MNILIILAISPKLFKLEKQTINQIKSTLETHCFDHLNCNFDLGVVCLISDQKKNECVLFLVHHLQGRQ